MENDKKLFLLDAYALIFRAYYAFINRPIRNSKGLNTSAIFGFVSTLDEIIRKEQPTHIAVGFDPPSPTFRHQMYEAYKANREATPPDIKLSVPYIKKILEAYQIPILEFDGYEADDTIGTLAKKASKEGYTVYMMTPDKDYAQLVEDGIFMYKPRRSGNEGEIWGVEKVKENFGVNDPLQVIDILALAGDASDNIPGAPGVGEKTAQKLIAIYESVEKLLEHTAELKGKQKENIESNIDQILLSKKLVTIDTNVPINIHVDEFKLKPIIKTKLGELFNELEFRTLSQRILGAENSTKTNTQGTLFEVVSNESDTTNVSNYNAFQSENVNYQLVKSESDWENLLTAVKKCSQICFDTETTGLDVLNDEIVGLSISLKEKEAWYIPFIDDFLRTTAELARLKELFEDRSILKIGHNIKFDIQILRKYDIKVCGSYFDTMIAHYLLHPESRHKLDNLTENLLNYRMIHIEELIGQKGKDQITMRQVPVEKVKDYACEDADFSIRLYNYLKPRLGENNLTQLADSIEFPLIDTLIEMELAGFNIDIDSLKEFEDQLNKDIIRIEKEIYSQAGEEFNIASPKQLGIILFEKLKISSNTRMTKTKQYSTSEEVLQRLRTTHPIIDLILEYRSVTKLQSTYVTTLPKLVDVNTKRIHSSFSQTITATGRLSSMNPNLQNIPIREERGREIRKSFIPAGKDFLLLSADYSQIELRLMAHMSGDEQMLTAFNQGADIHRSTAAKIYKVSEGEVTREMRSNAKTANFGIIYGISAFGLSQRLNIPRTEAKQLIDSYFESFPKVKKYMDASIEEAKRKGYVSTLFGRKRNLPDIHSSNSVVRGIAERNAINSPIQGTAADIIKIAMNRIHDKLQGKFKTKMILQVHDELVFDVYQPELEEIKNIVQTEMENAAKLSIPLEVEIGIGKNWLEAH